MFIEFGGKNDGFDQVSLFLENPSEASLPLERPSVHFESVWKSREKTSARAQSRQYRRSGTEVARRDLRARQLSRSVFSFLFGFGHDAQSHAEVGSESLLRVAFGLSRELSSRFRGAAIIVTIVSKRVIMHGRET